MIVTLQEAHERAKTIIRDGLDAQFQGKIRFREVRITPRLGAGDEEYLDVQVIYAGALADLNPRLLKSLYSTIEDDLRAIGIEKIPSISYREETEDRELSKAVPTSPRGG